MKTMKKLASLIMALAMVLALAVSVSAAVTPSITIKNSGKDVKYNVYKLFDATYNESTGTIAYTGTIPSGLEDYFVKDNATGAIKAKDGVDFTIANTNLMGALKTWAKTATTAVPEKTGVGGPLEITLTDFGYYVITSSLDGGAAVTLTSTNPTAEVNEKNDYKIPDVNTGDKTANVTSSDNGQDVKYTISFETVNFVNQVTTNDATARKVTQYIITDDLAGGKLTNIKDVSFKVDGEDAPYVRDGGVFTIDWLDGKGNSLYKNGANITIEYTATVTSETGAEAITNSFKVEYFLNDDELEKVPTEPEVTVYTSKITVNKVDENNQPLAGADFALMNSENKYYHIENNVVTWVDEQPEPDENNKTATSFVFTGLKDGNYTLVEIRTPDGYNTVDPNSDELKVEVKAAKDEVVELSTTVTNRTGLELPETGGIGTTIFTAVGSVLMIGAAILYITKKRSEDCAN